MNEGNQSTQCVPIRAGVLIRLNMAYHMGHDARKPVFGGL